MGESVCSVCANCGSRMKSNRKSYMTLSETGDLLEIRNVPLYVCGKCGDEFYSLSSLALIEQLEETSMGVVDYPV